MKFDQRPVPYTATSDDYAYGTNPIDWHEAFLTTFKWCLILVGLGVSIYLGYKILTG